MLDPKAQIRGFLASGSNPARSRWRIAARNFSLLRSMKSRRKFERVRQGRVALGKSFTDAGWAALTKDLETPLRIQWRPRPVKSTPAAVADAAAK